MAKALGADLERGLTSQEASRRLAENGLNELRAAPRAPTWRRILAHFQDPPIYPLRFFSVRRGLPRSELARLTQIDYAREMAFIAVRTLADGSAQTLGVVRAVIDPDNVDAEFAIIVRSDLKAHGLGHLLLRKMIDFLSGRGTQRMVGIVLRENRAMRELAHAQGLMVDAAASDGDALRFMLTLPASAAAPGAAR